MGNPNKPVPPQYIPNLKYWVQLVTPLVYEDGISLYETMRKVVYKLNQVIDIVNPLGAGIGDTVKQYMDVYKAEWEQQLIEFEAEVQHQINANNATVNGRIDTLTTNLTVQQTTFEKTITDKFNTLNEEIYQKVATLAATIQTTDEANRVWTIAQLNKLREDWTVNFPPVIDPTDGKLETVQTALNHMWDAWRENALTAEEYDNLDLTAMYYDAKDLTASAYDKYGKILLDDTTNTATVNGVPIQKTAIDMEGIKNGRY